MPDFRYDFNYTMENFWGDEIRIYGYDDGGAWVLDSDGQEHNFPDEEAAYNWTYKRGYRD